ncbi:MAG: hypothetical protein J7K61_00600 [Thermoplasmata archaeon]|nr:hypothetical protein [Thermoplasmata archaeon]
MKKKAVVCEPRREYFRVDDNKKHNIMEKANVEKAIKQHEELQHLLLSNGWELFSIISSKFFKPLVR